MLEVLIKHSYNEIKLRFDKQTSYRELHECIDTILAGNPKVRVTLSNYYEIPDLPEEGI